jgi:hypothetical protein
MTCYYLSPTRQATAVDLSTFYILVEQGYQRVSFVRWLVWCIQHKNGDIDDTQKT